MHRAFIRRPKRLAAATGLALAVGLAVVPAQADSKPSTHRPSSTGTLGRGAAPGGPVTPQQVIARAQHWVEQDVPYSQSHAWKDDVTGGHYRQDCSGFVSMAWQLKSSLTTRSLPDVANRLSGFSQLEAGDALNYPAAHALLFGGWTDRAKGDFVYYSESRSGRPARKESANIHDSRIAGHPRTVYVPLRYKKLVTTPPSAKPRPAPQPTKRPARTSPSASAAPAPAKQAPTPTPTKRPARSSTSASATPPAPATTSFADGTGTSFAATAHRLYAISPDHSGVYEYTGKGDRWVKVRGRTKRIYTSGSTLYATGPGGDIHRYDRARGTWKRVGGPGAEFAATAKRLYGISPDHSAVYEYTGRGDRWVKVRGRTSRIYTSAGTLYATDLRGGDIHRYDRARGTWKRVGGPGAEFAATAKRLYGISPDHSAVYEYTGRGDRWVKVRGRTSRIYTSAGTLYATDLRGGDIHQYDRAHSKWTRIGGPGADFAATRDRLYGASPDHSGVYAYTGTPDVWLRVGGPLAP
ncbi:hypothetical protein [Streptomyces lancefieldiae]|uniref:NlpC/P60 domain-containing protein n=1 Tax=Streptomyces lancefieldiae TaxID=3075520 RepID=A0ABU3AYV0_9ACTN|nr:hypothetical protein [Streptomyces sp. DSM 40712]MDT0615353.1 hypothetical protein [Streptomyces sp. DSM 40712]